MSLGDKNKDPNNTMFLINYDLLNISYMWSDTLNKLRKEIGEDMDGYNLREQMKNKYIKMKLMNYYLIRKMKI